MRIGFFFGAGAEVGYGLPSGGKFAIDLFRQDVTAQKQNLRTQLNRINNLTSYATDWLPERYNTQRIHAFGRNEFTSLIESSIEYRKLEIIRRLNDFDNEADRALRQLGISRQLLTEKFEEAIGHGYGNQLYAHAVRVNRILAEEARLFNSEFYSALLDAIRTLENSTEIQKYAAAFLQLLIGAHGQDLVQRLNHELFETAPDDIPIFDDICGMFRLEFDRAGLTAMELLLEERKIINIGEQSSIVDLLHAISQQILENIFTTVLDYQSLIDNHFRYLFSPKTEWAKFTKMVVFLWATRGYISDQLRSAGQLPQEGYYHDLSRTDEMGIEINAIGTANYNNIIESVASQLPLSIPEPKHLNGGVNDYYNPYKNSIETYTNPEEVPQDQIHVPFILTQSGLKPLTSVDMSRRYVSLFDAYLDSNAIVVIGYGFNIDDSHINGLFRELVENHGKNIFWICPNSDGPSESQKRNLSRRLRISPENNSKIHAIPISPDTRSTENGLWLEEIRQRVQQIIDQ